MKHYAIVIENTDISEHGFKQLKLSSQKVKNDFIIQRFNAVIPNQVDEKLAEYNIKWNYPWNGQVLDIASGLVKSAYVTVNPKARIACALSHYTLWKKCLEDNEPYLILEHDAKFINKIDFKPEDTSRDIIGINNPIGATRRSKQYHDQIARSQFKFQPVPRVDQDNVPQGLAGNSAYIIKPKGAERLLYLVEQLGLWPNDAIMCYQLVPNMCVTNKFYTTIQGLKSTTST